MSRQLFFGVLLLVVLLIAPAGAASAAPGSWTLVDNHQSACYYRPNGTTNYYGVWLTGSWSRSVSVSAAGLPSGSTTWAFDSPIPPGSSDGSGSLAYVAVQIPSSLANGTYTATLSATDGASSQSVPIGITVQTNCTNY